MRVMLACPCDVCVEVHVQPPPEPLTDSEYRAILATLPVRVTSNAQAAAVDRYDAAAGKYHALAEIERQKGHPLFACVLRNKARIAEVAAKRERFDV